MAPRIRSEKAIGSLAGLSHRLHVESRLIFGCAKAEFARRFHFQLLSKTKIAPIGRKEVHALFFSRKKQNIWLRATISGSIHNLRAPWTLRLGRPIGYQRFTDGQPSVTVGSTFGILSSRIGPIFVGFGYDCGRIVLLEGLLIQNDRFSLRETSFSGFVADWSRLIK